MNEITNNDGDTVTRINVMQVISYDVEQIVTELLEDMHADDAVVTLDDVLKRVHDLSLFEFGHNRELIYQDQDGNDI